MASTGDTAMARQREYEHVKGTIQCFRRPSSVELQLGLHALGVEQSSRLHLFRQLLHTLVQGPH